MVPLFESLLNLLDRFNPIKLKIHWDEDEFVVFFAAITILFEFLRQHTQALITTQRHVTASVVDLLDEVLNYPDWGSFRLNYKHVSAACLVAARKIVSLWILTEGAFAPSLTQKIADLGLS